MKQQPIVAFLYDFDKTLCTTDMQDYAFIPSLGMTPAEFWAEANGFGRRQPDGRHPGLYVHHAAGGGAAGTCPFTRADLVEKGRSIVLFPGVEDWFRRINDFGAGQGVQVEHYIISSGLREIIEGSSISGEFKEIYASEFYYDESGRARVAQAGGELHRQDPVRLPDQQGRAGRVRRPRLSTPPCLTTASGCPSPI